MKHETLFVDETTKKTMEQINEGIIDSVSEILRSTEALSSIEKLAGEISGKFDAFQKTSDDISERMKDLEKEIDSLKSTVIENQNRNSRLLEEINKKLDYISLPFYKRIMKKQQKENDIPPDAN